MVEIELFASMQSPRRGEQRTGVPAVRAQSANYRSLADAADQSPAQRLIN